MKRAKAAYFMMIDGNKQEFFEDENVNKLKRSPSSEAKVKQPWNISLSFSYSILQKKIRKKESFLSNIQQ